MMRQHADRSLPIWAIAALMIAAARPARGGESEWYAGIEIGSKGIKVIALPIDEKGKPELHRLVNKLPHQAVNNVTLKDLKDGRFRAAALEEARAAVADFYDQLTRAGVPNGPKIKPDHIWIVASSGLSMHRPANFDELEKAVAEATGGARVLEPISQRKEVELLMQGSIPRDQWENAVLVDVGSGNVKCGYIHPKRGPHVERPYVPEVELEGTVSYRQTIDLAIKKDKGGDSFRRFCKFAESRRDDLERDIADEIGRFPGLINSERRRVYVSGGCPYVIASLLHPVEMAREDMLEVRFTVQELRAFIDVLQNTERIPSPPLAGLSESDRKRAMDQIRGAEDIFADPKSLLAGAEILLGFSEALHWEEQKKEVYFTKSGLVAWIVGYVVESRAGVVRAADRGP